MERQERGPAVVPTIVPLPADQFWKLRALCLKTQNASQSAQLLVLRAQQAQDAFLAELGKQHGFNDRLDTFDLNDDKLTLSFVELEGADKDKAPLSVVKEPAAQTT